MSQLDPIALTLAKARRYLDTAEVLRQHGDYDSAVSRLYYAMFYCAQALLRAEGVTFTKHQAIIATFGRQFAKTKVLLPELHPWLRNAFDRRQASEYQSSTIWAWA
ncbi:MAG: HEPN domain-containing protein [Chloroflexi bacterium]|nr:HEPN domain-containing protein [Chloroflexota bacterium]MDA8187217.1 HEPN domain-containing protein [Dehalococcoidales bacterium]